jgi:hypothetical protein
MQNNDEDVFSFQYNSTSGSTDWGEGFYINGNFSCEWQGPRDPVGDPGAKGGWSFNIPTFALAAEFEDGDPRKDVSLYDASTKLKSYTRGYQNTGYFNNKFRSNPAYISAKGDPAHNWALNYPDIRYADVLLMAAELSLGTPDAALYLNKVRTRALGANAAKVSVTIDDIYHERRVELAGEGHRYWDILRRGLDYAKTQIDASFKNIPTKPMVNLPDFNTIDKQFDKTTYGMFPIPGSEVRLSGGVYKQNIPAYLGM